MRRLVLADDVTRDEIDDATARCGYHLTNVIPACEDIPAQLIYATASGEHLYVIEDGRLGVVYAAGADTSPALARLGEQLPAATIGPLRLDGDPDSLQRDLAARVLCAPDTPKTRDDLAQCLAHERAEVRRAALVAAAYAPSRVLMSALMRIRDEDDVLELRALAERLVATLRGLP